MPPSEAPTTAGRTPLRSARVSASTRASAAKSRVLIGAVGDPFGIAVAALIDGVGDAAHARDQIAGFLPGVAGLAAAVQQQHRRPLLAIDVADQRVAGRALEHRGGGRDRARHAFS